MERMYTTKQVAAQTGLNVQTIRRLCRDGDLTAVMVGGEWRVPESALAPKTKDKERSNAR